MRSFRFIRLLVMASIFLTIYGCQHKEQFAFEDSPEDVLAKVNQELLSTDSNQTGILTTSAKGSLWTAFTRTFRGCWQDATFRKNIVYMGPSNSKYLGAILSSDKQITWKSLEKVFNGDYEELKKFCQPGTDAPQNCSKDELINNYFNILLDGDFPDGIGGDLKLMLEDRRQIKMLSGKWRVDEIILGDFNSYMDTSKNPAVIEYKKYLSSGNNLLLTKILVIENFSAEIESNRSMEAGLAARLDSGIQTTLKAKGTDAPEANLSIGFSRNREGKIQVSATGKSYAIGMLQRVKKVTR